MQDLQPQVYGAIIGASTTIFLGVLVLIISNVWER